MFDSISKYFQNHRIRQYVSHGMSFAKESKQNHSEIYFNSDQQWYLECWQKHELVYVNKFKFLPLSLTDFVEGLDETSDEFEKRLRIPLGNQQPIYYANNISMKNLTPTLEQGINLTYTTWKDDHQTTHSVPIINESLKKSN